MARRIRFVAVKNLTENIFPYELPENWHWTTLENVADIKGGKRLPTGKKFSEVKTAYPYIRVIDFENLSVNISNLNYVDYDTYNLISRYVIFHSDIYISIAGSIGKVGIIPKELDGANLTENAAKITELKNINQKFLVFFLSSDTAQNQIKELTISTTQPKLALFRIKKISIPLPPLDEQKKIVECIESLFSKLDAAKSIVQKILDGYELRRSAILHKAFTGELTEHFRKENNLSLHNWQNLPLPSIFNIKSGSTLPVENEKPNGEIPYVKISDMNIKENLIQIVTSSRFVNSCREENIIPEGSVIFPKRGGAIFTNKKRYVGTEKIVADLNVMALIPICNKIFSWYGYYWLLSVDLKKICNGSNIPQINHKDMTKLWLLLPSLAEQKEIVRVLDSLLAKEQRTKDIAENILQEIDLLKKSILARAFRGEL